MAATTKERSFPRGGKKPAVASFNKQAFTLFRKKSFNKKASSKKRSKTVKKGTTSKTKKVNQISFQKSVKLLSYKELIEGTLTLGCVKEVREYDISLNLPGRLVAKVPVTNISDAYTSVLQSLTEGKVPDVDFYKLRDMFVEGQYVVCKVAQVQKKETGDTKVVATLCPHQLHVDFPPANLAVVGTVLTAAVRSPEEHGYVMDTGLPGVRAFLKKILARRYEEVWNGGKPLGKGQLVRCKITKATSIGTITTVYLTTDPDVVATHEEDQSSHNLLPGSLVTVTVTKVLSNGLCVVYNGDQVGYVSENYLSTRSSKLKSYSVGTEIKARLLYRLPTVKTAYFSLDPSVCSAEPPVSPFGTFKIGDILEKAKVIGYSSSGVRLQLGRKKQGLTGFVSTYRIGRQLFKDPETSFLEKLQALFPLGSRQKCVIIGYDYMEKLFYCTFEKDKMKQQSLSLDTLTLGQKIKCLIENVGKNGLVVKAIHGKESLQATVPPLHMSDVPLKHPEKKFIRGAKFPGRVLSLREGKLRLTLKPSLLSSKIAPVTQLSDMKPGNECEGVVVNLSNKGALVAFYGDACGWVPARNVSSDGADPCSVLYLGQVVHCYVQSVNIEKSNAILTMLPRGKVKNSIQFGLTYNLQVMGCKDDGLAVKVEGVDGVVQGMVPLQQLTDHPVLVKHLLETFQPGEILTGAFCCSEGHHPHFTLRQSLSSYFEWWTSRPEKKHGWEALEQGLIIPSTVARVDQMGVAVQLLFPGVSGTFFVPLQELSDIKVATVGDLGIVKDQILEVKILRIKKNKKLMLTAKVSQCWNGDLQVGVNLLTSYLRDQQRVIDFLAEHNDPLGLLNPGHLIEGQISLVSSQGAVLHLASGVRAVIEPHHYPIGAELKVGDTIQGKVLLIDIGHNCVEATLRQDIMERISSSTEGTTDLKVGMGVRAETLLAKPERVIVSLRGVGSYRLASVPTCRHINDLCPFTVLFQLGEVSKVVLQYAEADTLIVLPKKCVMKPYLLKGESIPHNTSIIFKEELIKSSGTISENIEMELETSGTGLSQNKIGTESDSGVESVPENNNNDSNIGTGRKRKCSLQSAELISPNHTPSAVPTKKRRRSSEVEISNEENTDATEASGIDKVSSTKNQCKYSENEPSIVVEQSTSFGSNIQNLSSKKKRQNLSKTADTATSSYVSSNFVALNDHTEDYGMKSENHNDSIKNSEEAIEFVNNNLKSAIDAKLVVSKGSKKERQECVETVTPLAAGTGFVWEADPSRLPAVAAAQADSDTSSDEDDQEENRKKRRRLTVAERRAMAREEEEKLREAERRLADSQQVPQTADDFDRLVLASPDSSMCWIKYMAFHLQATEIEKARAVAHRALKTISFREEQEKLNVWVALLNLENLYGTKESLDKVLEEAVQNNDPFKVHMQMLQIYAESSKLQEVEKLIGVMTKRYGGEKETWVQTGAVLMRCGQLEKARTLLQKALTRLDKKDHVELISRYAHLESKHGSPERAQTLMEHILTSYPKRVDIWCSYVDMLVKGEYLDLARKVLERAVVQRLPARKMKVLFKKFLQFEEQHGTSEGAERVRQMAVEYVESSTAGLEDADGQ